MTSTDVVEMRQVVDTQVSPDGRVTALVVHEPSVAMNTVTSRIVVVDTVTAGHPRTVVVETSKRHRITKIEWNPDGQSITYMSGREGADELWNVPVTGGEPQRVLDDLEPAVRIGGSMEPYSSCCMPVHGAKVLDFSLSSDGRYVAYTTPHVSHTADRDQGVVYDDETMLINHILNDRFDVYTTRLWIRDLATGQSRLVADFDVPRQSMDVGGLAWSPDSSKMAIRRMTGRDVGVALGLVLQVADADGGGLRTVAEETSPWSSPDWSPDSTRLLSQQDTTLVGIPVDGSPAQPVAELPSFADPSFYIEDLWWGDDDTVAADISARSNEYVYTGEHGTRLAPVAPGSDDLSGCDFDARLRRGVCVRQSIGSRPRLVAVDVDAHTLRSGFDFNRQMRDVRVTKPEKREWTNEYGTVADGYQIIPRTCREHGGCPVVVITHGRDARNKFMWAGHEWDFPSQVFAARGYVVLLVNEAKFPVPDAPWAEQRLNLGLDAVALMEAAVDAAVADGYADPAKAGIMGYSHGAMTVMQTVAHSDAFAAATAANGGDGEGTYWVVGNKQIRDYWGTMYGGSPVDPAAREHWEDIDPALNAHQIDAALLMQYDSDESLLALQLHSYLKDRNQPVELVIFPDDSHIQWQPAHRFSAMEQNLHWYDYWLQGQRDPSATKAEQYERWDAMRAAKDAAPSTSASTTDNPSPTKLPLGVGSFDMYPSLF